MMFNTNFWKNNEYSNFSERQKQIKTLLNVRQQFLFAVFLAEKSIPVFKKQFPKDSCFENMIYMLKHTLYYHGDLIDKNEFRKVNGGIRDMFFYAVYTNYNDKKSYTDSERFAAYCAGRLVVSIADLLTNSLPLEFVLQPAAANTPAVIKRTSQIIDEICRGLSLNRQQVRYIDFLATDDSLGSFDTCYKEQNMQISLLRPIKKWSKQYHTNDTITLAQTIYDQESWSLLPILADALMDAGCEEDKLVDLMNHHDLGFRGWWVLDKLTGRI